MIEESLKQTLSDIGTFGGFIFIVSVIIAVVFLVKRKWYK